MSDEHVASVSLEEAEPVSPPITPDQAAPAADPPPVEAKEDGEIQAATGDRFVPLAALQSERQKRKEAEQKVLPDADLQQLKQKAQLYDESAAYLQQAKPIIEKIKARPDILRLADQPVAPVQEPIGPLSQQEAIEYARDFDLYKQDGSPDVERAQRIAKRHADMTQRQTQQVVQPLVQNEAQRQSTALYQRYLQTPEVNGMKIDARYLAEVWNTVPPELIAANPNVGEVLFRTALANQFMSGTKPIAAPPPVVPTESAGGGKTIDQPLNSMSQKFQQVSGMNPTEFKATREKYNPSGANSLE